MPVIEVDLPAGVDPDEAKRVIAGVLATLAQGARLIFVPIPGDTPDQLMPRVALAAVAAARIALEIQ